jgi:Ser/Thr protein kinase RdoA (MazF antagonist)
MGSAPKPRVSPLAARVLERRGLQGLSAHVAERYGIEVVGEETLDVGVVRLVCRPGVPWVVRLFPADRPLAEAEHDAEVLRVLEQRTRFPAERLAHEEPVSVYEGQAVLVTQFVEGRAGVGTVNVLRALGRMLGGLHGHTAAPGIIDWPGGAWHHLAMAGGAPGADVDVALAALDEVEPALDAEERAALRSVRSLLARAEDGAGLPEGLLHPDFAPPNVIWTPDRRLVAVDWTGAGRGPRLIALGFLLLASGARDPAGVDAMIEGYRSAVDLDPEEWERLPGAITMRPLLYDAWGAAVGRRTFAGVLAAAEERRSLGAEIAARARTAWHRPSGPAAQADARP